MAGFLWKNLDEGSSVAGWSMQSRAVECLIELFARIELRCRLFDGWVTWAGLSPLHLLGQCRVTFDICLLTGR